MKEFWKFVRASWEYKGMGMITPSFFRVWSIYKSRLEQAEADVTINRVVTRKQFVADRKRSRKLNKELRNGTTD